MISNIVDSTRRQTDAEEYSLVDFADKYCRRHRLLGRKAGTYRHYVQTLLRVNEMLKRSAIISDLNHSLVVRFKAFLEDRGNASITTKNRCIALRKIWKVAFDRHFSDNDPASEGVPVEVSLRSFFERKLVGTAFAKSAHQIASYRWTVNTIARILDRPPLLSDLNADVMDQVKRALRQTNLSPRTFSSRMMQFRALWVEAYRRQLVANEPTYDGRRQSSRVAVVVRRPSVIIEDEAYFDRSRKDPRPLEDSSIPLMQYLDRYYVPERLFAARELTIEQYRIAVRFATKALGREVMIKDLSPRLIADIVRFGTQRHLSKSTTNGRIRHIGCIWRQAHHSGFRCIEPCRTRIKEPKRFKTCWTTDQIASILASCLQEEGWIGAVPAADWWFAFIVCMYDSGVRKRALLHVPRENFDLAYRAFRVPADVQKQNRDQWCAISDQCVNAIKKIWSPEREFLFEWPYDQSDDSRMRTLDNHFKIILRRAGLNGDEGLFHRIRRSRATYGEMIAVGSATQDLGHQNRSTTLAYLDHRVMGLSRIADRIPRPEVNHPIVQHLNPA
ncbi:phage integrase SAM-like domain-containing protein [bacterium]|nr:phage integrase SAM-like domain-containing protein [bacterium]